MTTLFAIVVAWSLAAWNTPRVLLSRYDFPGDSYAGGAPACEKRLPDVRYKELYPIRCAHRTFPCGTLLVVVVEQRITICAVLDRGPYGAMLQGKWVLKLSARQPGRWRGGLDLSPHPAAALGLGSAQGLIGGYYFQLPTGASR